MKLYKFFAIASILSLAFATSCEKEDVKEASSMTLDQNSVTIYVGQTATVTPSFTPSNADPDMVWKSSDETVATVNGGYVCGIAPGTATITVTASGNVTTSFPVTVLEVKPTKFVLDKTALTLYEEGAGYELTTTLEPYNVTYTDIVWVSSNPAVVEVDSLGALTQKSLGTATITATLHGDRAVAKCNVTVRVEVKDKADTTVCWKSDKAWHKSIYGAAEDDGKTSVGGSMTYDYAQGMVEWTENTTNFPRTDSIVLSTGAKLVLTQVDAKDFKGTWNLRSSRFTKGKATTVIGKDSDKYASDEVEFGNPLVANDTLSDFNGASHVNNLGIKGLCLEAVADACVEIDYNKMEAKLGFFLDARDNGQKISKPYKTDYSYVAFLPELGSNNTFGSPWYFTQPDLDSSKDYCWLWFTANASLNTFTADLNKEPQMMTGDLAPAGNYIIGITVAASKTKTIDANCVLSANAVGTWDGPVIYQGNPNPAKTSWGYGKYFSFSR